MRARFLCLLAGVTCAAACGARSSLDLDEVDGAAAAGGTGGTTEPGCTPGEVEACYSGPAGTLDVGSCAAGKRACLSDGVGFGPCEGEVLPAPDLCHTAADEDCDGVGGVSCEQSPYWSLSLPEGDGITIRADPAGNVILATFCDGADLIGAPAGNDKSCLAMLDPFGNLLWSKQMQGWISAMELDPAGNLWIAGYFSGPIDLGGGPLGTAKRAYDVLIAKLGPAGNHLYSAGFGDDGGGDDYQLAWDLAVTPDGGAVVIGDFGGTLSLGGETFTAVGEEDAFVVRLGPSGEHLWSRALHGNSFQHGHRVLALADGSLIVAGSHYEEIDIGGVILGSDGESDMFVAKLDEAGDHVWSHRIGGPGLEGSPHVVPGPGGGFFLSAAFFDPLEFGATTLSPEGQGDTLVGRLAPDGTPLDAQSFMGGVYSTIRDITATADGGVVLTGWFDGPLWVGDTLLEGEPSAMFVVRLDAAANPVSARQFGEGAYLGAYDVALDPEDNVLVIGGFYESSIDFGDQDSPHSAVDLAMFAAKLPP